MEQFPEELEADPVTGLGDGLLRDRWEGNVGKVVLKFRNLMNAANALAA